jgi:hypothetical protein
MGNEMAMSVIDGSMQRAVIFNTIVKGIDEFKSAHQDYSKLDQEGKDIMDQMQKCAKKIADPENQNYEKDQEIYNKLLEQFAKKADEIKAKDPTFSQDINFTADLNKIKEEDKIKEDTKDMVVEKKDNINEEHKNPPESDDLKKAKKKTIEFLNITAKNKFEDDFYEGCKPINPAMEGIGYDYYPIMLKFVNNYKNEYKNEPAFNKIIVNPDGSKSFWYLNFSAYQTMPPSKAGLVPFEKEDEILRSIILKIYSRGHPWFYNTGDSPHIGAFETFVDIDYCRKALERFTNGKYFEKKKNETEFFVGIIYAADCLKIDFKNWENSIYLSQENTRGEKINKLTLSKINVKKEDYVAGDISFKRVELHKENNEVFNSVFEITITAD